jgi:multidrug efflux system membrane fusion protein
MHLETLNNVTEVSTSAIGHDAKGAFVYVVSPEKTVALHLVTLGATEGDKVVVLDNLAANEMVVVEGADRLKEGSKVDISEKDGQTVAASPVDSVKPDSKPRKKFRQL